MIENSYLNCMENGIVVLEKAENYQRNRFYEEAYNSYKLAEHLFLKSITMSADAGDNDTTIKLKDLIMYVSFELDELGEELSFQNC